MKQVVLEEADLKSCVRQAQRERVVVLRRGRPVALVVSVDGMDPEQLELGSSEKFWKLIAKRRKQKGMTRAQLEAKLGAPVIPNVRNSALDVPGVDTDLARKEIVGLVRASRRSTARLLRSKRPRARS